MSALSTVDLSFSTRGTGRPLLMLHPGGVDSRALDPLVSQLESDYRVLTPDQRAHGRTPDAPGPLDFELMAADTVALIEREYDAPVDLLGYSDGAIVALTVAVRRPDLVRSLVFACAVFHRDGWRPGVLDGEPPEFFRDLYAEVSPDGRDHWPEVVAKMAEMHARQPDLTVDDLARLTMPVLVVSGDDDEIEFGHLIAMFEALPDGELAVVPRATHGLIAEKPDLLARLVRDFHRDDKTDGLAPLRRG
ncbi:alpha/beta fold hydrolase [Nakamurella sp. YIM 132087]|uniref:Alpha/beta fold hydrolase n=1 Tax=Nakamurella alba TaxID=2665158 RepID=A0A7K1FSM6_9ACTN|nr:alpha/beta hydrolase [Nakamurella alba]MTD17155.1 alpha/beta fold hydrolase [Nakamurella alba]